MRRPRDGGCELGVDRALQATVSGATYAGRGLAQDAPGQLQLGSARTCLSKIQTLSEPRNPLAE